MLIRTPHPLAPLPSEITPPGVYEKRRNFLRQAGAGATALLLGGCSASSAEGSGEKLPFVKNSRFSVDESATSFADITRYNNFYEFGPDKTDPARWAPQFLKPRPWSIRIEGEVLRPLTFTIEDILRMAPLEERIYRLRCVEAWSMVIPWVGFSLSELIRRCGITGNAKFVEFYTLADPEQMPYVRVPFMDWPYMEALRMDEAMHPLAILAVGLYGQTLPHQNGAPVRLIAPWKYGFKSAKSIVRMRFVEQQPDTIWSKSGDEYGFYANVNPEVDHPRWSQRSERRIGEFFKRKTLMFNGYADEVAGLYTGMDLRKHF